MGMPQRKYEPIEEAEKPARPIRQARPRPDADFDETMKRVMAKTAVSRAILAE